MTRQVKYYAQCHDCHKSAVCPECGQMVSQFSPFSDWLRSLPPPLNSTRISLHNLDYIWHNYIENWFITIEEKRFGARCTAAQKDTHTLLVRFLEIANDIFRLTNGRITTGILRRRDLKEVEYRGHYVVVFEQTNPDDSRSIEINGFGCDRDDLLRLLETGKLTREPA